MTSHLPNHNFSNKIVGHGSCTCGDGRRRAPAVLGPRAGCMHRAGMCRTHRPTVLHTRYVHTVRACDSYHVCTGGECVQGATQRRTLTSVLTSCRCAHVLAAVHCSSTYMYIVHAHVVHVTTCLCRRGYGAEPYSSLQLIVFSPHSKLAMMARLTLGLLSRAGFAQAPSARAAVYHVVVILSVSWYNIMVLFS